MDSFPLIDRQLHIVTILTASCLFHLRQHSQTSGARCLHEQSFQLLDQPIMFKVCDLCHWVVTLHTLYCFAVSYSLVCPSGQPATLPVSTKAVTGLPSWTRLDVAHFSCRLASSAGRLNTTTDPLTAFTPGAEGCSVPQVGSLEQLAEEIPFHTI